MKIISVNESKEQKKNPENMDLMDIDVVYSSGESGKIYIYRANLNALLKKQELVEKYGIPEKEMDDFVDLVMGGYEADHYFD